MRLIDADALKKYKCSTCDNRERCEDRETVCSEIVDIDEQPTIEAEPVKRGRWIWVKNYRDCEGDIYSQYKCSCCDFVVGGVYSDKDLAHFCDNCGADMRW